MSDKIMKDELKIADKLSIRGTQVLTAKNIIEFDELMVYVADYIESYPTHVAKVSVDFARDTYIPNCTFMTTIKGQIIANDLKSKESFLQFISQIREAENNFLLQILKSVNGEQFYSFSCTVTLKVESKDKNAKRMLESHQLEIFAPVKPVKYIIDDERIFLKAIELQKKINNIENSIDYETVERDDLGNIIPMPE